MSYVRHGWTGAALRFSDGQEDPEWAQCPSCLGYHHERSKSCNGKREPCDRQCDVVLGEARCERPANHLGVHEAKSSLMRVEWEIYRDDAREAVP